MPSLYSRVARRKPLIGPNNRYAIKYDGTKLLVGVYIALVHQLILFHAILSFVNHHHLFRFASKTILHHKILHKNFHVATKFCQRVSFYFGSFCL